MCIIGKSLTQMDCRSACRHTAHMFPSCPPPQVGLGGLCHQREQQAHRWVRRGTAGSAKVLAVPAHFACRQCAAMRWPNAARFAHLRPLYAPARRLPSPPCTCAGVWLLARCADLQGLEYDVRRFGLCLLALFGLGLLFR